MHGSSGRRDVAEWSVRETLAFKDSSQIYCRGDAVSRRARALNQPSVRECRRQASAAVEAARQHAYISHALGSPRLQCDGYA